MPKKNSTYRIKVPDTAVEHHWQCPNCHEVTADMKGSQYPSTGIPFCSDCEVNMEYGGTYVLFSGKLMHHLQTQTVKIVTQKQKAEQNARTTLRPANLRRSKAVSRRSAAQAS